MKSIPAMIEKGRKTKQGLRDLNYYGPRRGKNAAGEPPAATVAGGNSGREARPPAIAPVGAPDEDAVVK